MPADIAQHSLPSYVIKVSDARPGEVNDDVKSSDSNSDNAKSNRLRPAHESEYPDKDPSTKAQKFRHRYRYSMSVLGGMFVFLITGVILILRKRDSDLQ
jgi:hypothetical protein